MEVGESMEVLEDVSLVQARRISPNLVRGVSLLVVILCWEIFGRRINPLFMSYPSAIAVAFVNTAVSGDLLKAVIQSAQSLIIGYVAAGALGIIVGLLMGKYKMIEYAIDPYMNALYSTPLIAFIPLIILWVGLGLQAKIILVFILSFFPVLINTYIGVRDVSKTLIEVGKAFVASEKQIFIKIILPATVPYVMGGLRLAVGRAIIGMVVAEFFTAISGLGAMIITYANFFKTDYLFVPIIVLMIMGVGLTELVKLAERKIAPWKETERAIQ